MRQRLMQTVEARNSFAVLLGFAVLVASSVVGLAMILAKMGVL